MNNQEVVDTKKILTSLTLLDMFPEIVLEKSLYLYFSKKEQIVTSDEPFNALYFILKGKIFVTSYALNGDKVIIDTMEQGEFFGDIELYSNKKLSLHNVVATPQTIVLKIPATIVNSYLNKHVSFLNFMCLKLTEKLMNTSYKYSKALLLPAKNKLARYITEQFELHQHHIIPLSVQKTSELLGISDRHIRRLLYEFEEKKIIEKQRKHIAIKNLEELYKLANQ